MSKHTMNYNQKAMELEMKAQAARTRTPIIEVVNMTSNTITLRVITHKVITRTYLNHTMTQAFGAFKRTMREEGLAAETALVKGSF